jgi:hypothetical protein
MVSLPAPPVRMLAAVEPVSETPIASAEASTFWKLATVGVSPVVWSGLARLTVVAAFRIRVLLPVPPSIEL